MVKLVKSAFPDGSELTAYKVDGLELFFTSDRKVRASQSAIARMCSSENKTVKQGQIRQLILTLAHLNIDVVRAEAMTSGGLQPHLLYESKVIVACLAKYNPVRLADFTVFGIDEGLAQMAGVPLPTPIPATPSAPALSSAEQLMELAKAAMSYATLQLAAEKNPGDVRQMTMTLEADPKALDGTATIFEMAERNGFELTPDQGKAVGMVMAGAVKMRKESVQITKVTRRRKSDKGHYQSYEVNSYPLSMESTFLSAYNAVANIHLGKGVDNI
jgi:hypothetical protein